VSSCSFLLFAGPSGCHVEGSNGQDHLVRAVLLFGAWGGRRGRKNIG